MALARQLVAGVDLWLNTPQPPLEASGTSGMKAAVNGVPQLSILDGWREGCIEGFTGWAVSSGSQGDASGDAAAAAESGCSADSGLLGRLLSHVRRGVV